MLPKHPTAKRSYLHLHQEDGLKQSWLSGQHGRPHGTAGCWDDLTPTAVGRVGVDGGISHVEAHTSQCFLAQYALEKYSHFN